MIINSLVEIDAIGRSCQNCRYNNISICMLKYEMFDNEEEGYCSIWEKHKSKAAKMNSNFMLYQVEERAHEVKRG